MQRKMQINFLHDGHPTYRRKSNASQYINQQQSSKTCCTIASRVSINTRPYIIY